MWMQSIQGLALADDRCLMVIANIDGGGKRLMQPVTVERGVHEGYPSRRSTTSLTVERA